MRKLLTMAVLLLGSSSALAAWYGGSEGVFSLDQARPNPRITPGAVDPSKHIVEQFHVLHRTVVSMFWHFGIG